MIESRNNGDPKEKVETSKFSEFYPEEIFCNNDQVKFLVSPRVCYKGLVF